MVDGKSECERKKCEEKLKFKGKNYESSTEKITEKFS